MKPAQLLKKATLYSVFLAIFFLPLKTSLSNFGIIILIFLSALSFIKSGIRKDVLKSPGFYLGTTLALYIPIIVGTCYAPSLSEAFFQWTKSIFFLLVPVVLLRNDLRQSEVLLWGSRGLITGGILSMIGLLLVNAYNFAISGLPMSKLLGYSFTGKSFLSPLSEMHPVYFGSYVVFMAALLWREEYRLKPSMKWGITCLSATTIIFLNSRIIFLVALVLFCILLFRKMRLKSAAAVLGGFIFLIALTFPYLQETYLYTKLTQGTFWELTENVAEPNTDASIMADSRMSRWKVSLELFYERPIIGHGTGSARELLVERYRDMKMEASIRQRYDSHNQYLGFAIEYGLIGLSLISIFLFSNMYFAIRNANLTCFIFYFMIGAICLTENYLIRNMGINLVALFGAFFYLNDAYTTKINQWP
jgi:O-antigen ligase